jgi:archaemetzincin
MSRLLLSPLTALDRGLIPAVAEGLEAALPLTVELATLPVDQEDVWDEERGQYHSTFLLDLLVAAGGLGNGDRILGITEGDLFIPILTFVFGEAQVGGPGAIFSVARLRPTFYGLGDDPGLLIDRAVKEALHEVGHTFGLLHCRHPECAMRASTNAGEVDLKPASLCKDCRQLLRA